MLQGIEREWPSGRWRSKYDLYTQGAASKSIIAMQSVESEIYFTHNWIIVVLIKHAAIFCSISIYRSLLALYNVKYCHCPIPDLFFLTWNMFRGKKITV